MGNCVVTPPSQVAVISGPGRSRMIIGECGFQKWFIESLEVLSLELIALTLQSNDAETVQGVRVTVSATCEVKVDAFTHGDSSHNLPQITLACQHFLGKTPEHVHQALLRMLERHQRQVIGTLTAEELCKDQASFSQRVREHMQEDLTNMGFILVSYEINQVNDSNRRHTETPGAARTALDEREAEGESKNVSEAEELVVENEIPANMARASHRLEDPVGNTMEIAQ